MRDLCGSAGAIYNCAYLIGSFKREIKIISSFSGGRMIKEQCKKIKFFFSSCYMNLCIQGKQREIIQIRRAWG